MPDHDDLDGRATIGQEHDTARHHQLRIRRILERRIMPSLILDPSMEIPSSSSSENREGQSDALVAMALQGREEQARVELRALSDRGMEFEQLQLGLLAPAAEKLGHLWDSDSVSFVDVTIATGTLQRLMHFVAIDLEDQPLIPGRTRTMLMFQEPGAEHTLGAAMAARFFQRAGWHVDHLPGASQAKLVEQVQRRRYDVLALSISVTDKTKAAARLVTALRSASKNTRAITLGGGSALTRDPLLIGQLGLDALGTAIAGAPDALTRLVAAQTPAN
ncbi:MAG: cobalamin B12-binding domain-containing protein [Pseudomonadota bacterium]